MLCTRSDVICFGYCKQISDRSSGGLLESYDKYSQVLEKDEMFFLYMVDLI